ncbi:MAG TPA: hypothetical protein P5262_00680 [Candidatus Moranbacteria bacterium]|nr:hypothetical protein [Candidatus Moranbacteria bacterium]
MLDKKLKEALELIGGKAVLKDQDQYYVLLTLREFRKLQKTSVEGLTKQELVDKINNDIASWKFVQEEKKIENLELGEISDIKENEEIRYEKA